MKSTVDVFFSTPALKRAGTLAPDISKMQHDTLAQWLHGKRALTTLLGQVPRRVQQKMTNNTAEHLVPVLAKVLGSVFGTVEPLYRQHSTPLHRTYSYGNGSLSQLHGIRVGGLTLLEADDLMSSVCLHQYAINNVAHLLTTSSFASLCILFRTVPKGSRHGNVSICNQAESVRVSVKVASIFFQGMHAGLVGLNENSHGEWLSGKKKSLKGARIMHRRQAQVDGCHRPPRP